jgi:hypothetical protein
MFEQPDDGTESFSCRVKTGLWNGDRVGVDNDGVCVVEVIERGRNEPSSGTRWRESSTSSTSHEVNREG